MATFFILIVIISSSLAQSYHPAIHLPLFRRGGRFSRHEPANLTYLADILQAAEAQYARNHRQVEGNRLVRKWRTNGATDENDPDLIDVAGHENRWYETRLWRLGVSSI